MAKSLETDRGRELNPSEIKSRCVDKSVSEPTKTKVETLRNSNPASTKIGKAERSSVSLLIPWSVREGFTDDICGLPSEHHGCWRFRKSDLENKDRGIRPSVMKDHEPLIAWIVFESSIAGEDPIRVRVKEQRPSPTYKHHQALFGFTKKGLKAFAVQANSSDCPDYPNYMKFVGIVEGREVDIKNWLRDSDDETDELGLADCFGQNTFIPQLIESETFDLRGLKISLSDLIRSYLNHNQDCRFRRYDSARGVGITMCKVGMELSNTSFTGGSSQATENKPPDLLSASAVSFSYLDNATSTLIKLPQWCIDNNKCDVSDPSRDDYLASLHQDYFVPLRVRSFEDRPDRSPGIAVTNINFATSLSRYGRQSVLPTEVGKSFLNFSIGEIGAYLAHWLLLRIFASDDPDNTPFIDAFVKWRELLRSNDGSHTQHFLKLLNTRVAPILDRNIFTERIVEVWQRERFGIYTTAIPFVDALSFLGLSTGRCGARILPTLAFLRQFFDPNESFQKLPMYKELDWRQSVLLNGLTSSSTKENKIEALLGCLAHASGLRADESRTSTALTELKNHFRRSVFPIADVLANVPYCGNVPLHYYFVFPLWEDTISDESGQEWRGPVIFAHVVTQALQMIQENSLPSDREVVSLGEQLQNVLLPAGAAIAHGYYNEERKNTERLRLAQETAWKLARAWAHEVKNYTAPVIDDLNDADLQDSRRVSPEARDIINRSRRTILILNAASRAVQLSLSNKVGKDGTKASDIGALKKLNPDRAEEIVECVLQYLLNYRADVLKRDFTLKWTPSYSTQQMLAKLASLLGKKKSEAEEKILSDNRVIWIIALLREVVWNIRIEDAYVERPDEIGTVTMSYNFLRIENYLRLVLVQQQVQDGPWDKSKAAVVGIELANTLFGQGAEAGGFGFIGKGEIQNKNRGADLGVEITYTIPVDFALS
jgi:hypothetical protein